MKSRTWMWSLSVWLFAALAMPVQARVVYTPVNVTLPASGSYLIDLNHDGITDFTFQISHTFYLCNFERFAYRNTLKVQPSPAGGIVGFNWASALQSGVQIDFHQSFYGSDDLMYDVQQSSGGPCRPPHMYGYWIAVQHHYLGLEFQINGQPHYGWAELSTNGTTGVNTLYGFAYETIPLKGILTGQTSDAPDELGMASPVSPAGMAAEGNLSPDNKHEHHQYKLIDLGTLGGPNSSVPIVFNELNGSAGAQAISNQGAVTGTADTSTPDPLCYFDDCFYPNAFEWQNGVLTNLGALPGTQWSTTNWISGNGLIAGISLNGETDPLSGFPEGRAVLWQGNSIADLGTLQGGYESFAFGVNNRGQVVGDATNGIPDPYSYFYGILGISTGTQTRAFLWDKHKGMQDLGTLGGPDAWANIVNDGGQVTGISYTSFTANGNGPCGPFPTTDPFFWDKDLGMLDIGSFGGTCGLPNALNNRGQVAGQSYLSGNIIAHAFLWEKRGRPRLTDLGTLGGDNASALWLNDAGDVVGYADLPPNPLGCMGLACVHHGFLWRHGLMTDLGTIGTDPCSRALSINSRSQIVGATAPCGGSLAHGFLWENGGPAVDLNTLVAPGSGLALVGPSSINDRGEIAGYGVLSNGDTHAFLLIPCDEKHPGECEDYSMIEVATPQTSALAQFPTMMKQGGESPVNPVERLRNMMRQRYHIPGQPQAPRN